MRKKSQSATKSTATKGTQGSLVKKHGVLGSFASFVIFDFLEPEDLLRLQATCKFLYEKRVPAYWVRRSKREDSWKQGVMQHLVPNSSVYVRSRKHEFQELVVSKEGGAEIQDYSKSWAKKLKGVKMEELRIVNPNLCFVNAKPIKASSYSTWAFRPQNKMKKLVEVQLPRNGPMAQGFYQLGAWVYAVQHPDKDSNYALIRALENNFSKWELLKKVKVNDDGYEKFLFSPDGRHLLILNTAGAGWCYVPRLTSIQKVDTQTMKVVAKFKFNLKKASDQIKHGMTYDLFDGAKLRVYRPPITPFRGTEIAYTTYEEPGKRPLLIKLFKETVPVLRSISLSLFNAIVKSIVDDTRKQYDTKTALLSPAYKPSYRLFISGFRLAVVDPARLGEDDFLVLARFQDPSDLECRADYV